MSGANRGRAVLIAALAGLALAAPARADRPLLRTTALGQIVGTEDSHGTHAWLGVPDDAPPIGGRGQRAPHLPGAEFRDCRECPLMRVIPAGSFQMGSDSGGADSDEGPRRWVAIPRPFAAGVLEVTRGQFAQFVAETGHDAGDSCHDHRSGAWRDVAGRSWRDPGFDQGDDHPVVCVSWRDAGAYVEWLGRRTGRRYRLLSEAEWEYLARTGRGSQGDPVAPSSHDGANHGATECCGPRRAGRDAWDYTAPAGSFPADALGLHDVLGNVWEWLEDCYHESYEGAPADGTARTTGCSQADSHAVRGGSWGDAAELLRPGYRLRAPAGGRYFTLGLRVARDLD